MYAPLNTALSWALFPGFDQGAGPALGAYLFVTKSASVDTAARISSMTQTVRCLIAIARPLLTGSIYQRTGGWHIPIVLLAVILVIERFVSLPAGRGVKV